MTGLGSLASGVNGCSSGEVNRLAFARESDGSKMTRRTVESLGLEHEPVEP